MAKTHPSCSPVSRRRTIDDSHAGPLRQAWPAARLEGTPISIRNGAPRLGEHTRDGPREVGDDDVWIKAMMAKNVLHAEEAGS